MSLVFLPTPRDGTVLPWGKPHFNVEFIGYDDDAHEWMYLTDDGEVRFADTSICRVSARRGVPA